MGLELIEDSELGALAPSRLGNKCFIDDDRYANLSWVSKGEKNRRAESDADRVNRLWSLDPIFAKNCTYLQKRLDSIQDALKGEYQKNPSETYTDRTIKPMINWETQYKNALTRENCVDIKLKQEKSEEEKKNLELIQKAGETPPPMLPDVPTTKSKTTTYVIIGVGSLALIIIGMALLKK